MRVLGTCCAHLVVLRLVEFKRALFESVECKFAHLSVLRIVELKWTSFDGVRFKLSIFEGIKIV